MKLPEIPIILADGLARMALSGAIGMKDWPGIYSKGRASTKQNIVLSALPVNVHNKMHTANSILPVHTRHSRAPWHIIWPMAKGCEKR
jgi:hypothetical protein